MTPQTFWIVKNIAVSGSVGKGAFSLLEEASLLESTGFLSIETPPKWWSMEYPLMAPIKVFSGDLMTSKVWLANCAYSAWHNDTNDTNFNDTNHFSSGHDIQVQTSTVYEYKTFNFLPKEDFLLFDVMACNNIHLSLAETPGEFTKNAYEVVIGGWDNTRYHACLKLMSMSG